MVGCYSIPCGLARAPRPIWGVPGEQTYPEPSFSREITEEGPFPIAGARVVVFKKATRAECVVCLPQHRLLVTCDSVQHYDHDPLISTLGKLVMYPMGFFTPCVIGPIWLKAVTPPGGSMRGDFERLLALDFDRGCRGSRRAVLVPGIIVFPGLPRFKLDVDGDPGRPLFVRPCEGAVFGRDSASQGVPPLRESSRTT